MSDKRIILCSQLIEQANSFDLKGDHNAADQFTKVARQLSNNEISIREALNFGRMLGGLIAIFNASPSKKISATVYPIIT